MAGGWNSGSDREAMLRRVAIVLSSLPAPLASKLLGSVAPESKQAVRRTMSTLADVDPLERQRAIQAFKVMFESQPTRPLTTSPDGDSLQIPTTRTIQSEPSSSRVVVGSTPAASVQVTSQESAHHGAAPRRSDGSPLAFLGEVADSTLARLLREEHPQTIAFVLATISPQQAANVLPQLGSKLQRETMSRIGRLGEIPDTAVTEVADHFRSRLCQQGTSEHHALGRRALDAILAAMPQQHASEPALPPDGFRHRVGDVAQANSPASNRPAVDPPALDPPALDPPALDLSQRLKLAEETWPDQFVADERQSPKIISDQYEPPSRIEEAAEDVSPAANLTHAARRRFDSTDGIHEHLIGLSPKELCEALGSVDTRDALLTLCGLPLHVADAALAALPRSQSKAVRIKMNSLGSLHLREIDRAKEKVAEASLDQLPALSRTIPLAA